MSALFISLTTRNSISVLCVDRMRARDQSEQANAEHKAELIIIIIMQHIININSEQYGRDRVKFPVSKANADAYDESRALAGQRNSSQFLFFKKHQFKVYLIF